MRTQGVLWVVTPAGLAVERSETFKHRRCETTSGLRIRKRLLTARSQQGAGSALYEGVTEMSPSLLYGRPGKFVSFARAA